MYAHKVCECDVTIRGVEAAASWPHHQPRQRSVSRHCLRHQHRTEHTQHMETWKHVTSLHCAIVRSFMQVLFNCLQMSSQHKN